MLFSVFCAFVCADECWALEEHRGCRESSRENCELWFGLGVWPFLGVEVTRRILFRRLGIRDRGLNFEVTRRIPLQSLLVKATLEVTRNLLFQHWSSRFNFAARDQVFRKFSVYHFVPVFLGLWRTLDAPSTANGCHFERGRACEGKYQ